MKKATLNLIGGLLLFLLLTYLAFFFFAGNKNTENNFTELIHQAKGEVIFKPQFVGPSFFQEGMGSYSTRPVDAPLFVGGGATGEPFRLNLTEDLSGFISSSGDIFPPIYKAAYSYSEGLAAVSIDGEKYGAIDKKGIWVISPSFAWLNDFKNGLATFKKNENDKYGYLNKNGNVVIDAKFESAGQFSENRALVCEELTDYEDSTCGFIDETGTPITDFVYSQFHSNAFSEGLAKVCQGKGKNLTCGFIDLDGKIVKKLTNDVYQNEYGDWSSTLNSFSGGLALYGGQWFDGIQKWGFINKKFELQIPIMITKGLFGLNMDPDGFSGDIQWQTLGTTKDNPGQSAAIDKFGKIKFYSTYDEVSRFSQGLSAVRIGNKWGFINQENELVVEAIYDDVRAYEGGFASVRVGDKWGVIN